MSMSHQLPLSQYGVEIIWNLEVKAKSELNNEHPDITVELKKLKKWLLIDVATPPDQNIVMIEDVKVPKYLDLASAIRIRICPSRDYTCYN